MFCHHWWSSGGRSIGIDNHIRCELEEGHDIQESLELSLWNVKPGACGLNAIIHLLQGEDKFKNLTRASLLEDMGLDSDEDDELTVKHIMDWTESKQISTYIVGADDQLKYRKIGEGI